MKNRFRKSPFGRFVVAPLCVGLIAAGCGGGGGNAGNVSGPGQSAQVGPVAVSFTGHPQEILSMSSGQITAVGQAGATYTSLSINPAHNLQSTYIAFERNFGNIATRIYTYPVAGNATPTQLIGSGYSEFPTISQSGVVAFWADDPNGASAQGIYSCLGDGSAFKPVFTGSEYEPAISPNGATVAYVDELHNVYTVSSAGGSATEIYSGGDAVYLPPVWSPSGTTIAFSRLVSSHQQIWTMTSAGGSLTNITPAGFATGNITVNSWSPDGNSLACTYLANGASNTSAALVAPTGSSYYVSLTPTGFNDAYPTFSPDSRMIAFYRSNAGGATPGIYTSDIAMANPQLLLPDPGVGGQVGPAQGLVWSPFQSGQIFAGAHGTITGSSVNGFLVSQNGGIFASLLTFNTTTPSTATLSQSGTSTNGAPMAFTLGGDSITNISYANVYSGAHSSIPLSSTPSAIVTVDAMTGFVDYVVPALAVKAKPMVAHTTGSSLSYTGQFSAIYDRTGKNLAPSGATEVSFDKSTGKLISFR